jgi:hypothetical protein
MNNTRVNIDSNIWGPKAWYFLDYSILSFPDNPTPADKEGFKNSSNNLTKGLAPKIQKYLLTQTSLASDNTNEFFQADTTILEIGDLAPQDEDEDNLVGDDTTSNPNNLGQAYVESSNNIMCPAGFSFRNDNCQVWDEAIANKDNSN